MQKTYLAKKNEIKRAWHIIDAQDKILGRLAVQAAKILRGKHKPQWTPNLDCGDNVIIINAAKVKVTGRKLTQKVYRRYSGYPGGPLGRDLLKKLKVYGQAQHPHASAKPKVLEVK